MLSQNLLNLARIHKANPNIHLQRLTENDLKLEFQKREFEGRQFNISRISMKLSEEIEELHKRQKRILAQPRRVKNGLEDNYPLNLKELNHKLKSNDVVLLKILKSQLPKILSLLVFVKICILQNVLIWEFCKSRNKNKDLFKQSKIN